MQMSREINVNEQHQHFQPRGPTPPALAPLRSLPAAGAASLSRVPVPQPRRSRAHGIWPGRGAWGWGGWLLPRPRTASDLSHLEVLSVPWELLEAIVSISPCCVVHTIHAAALCPLWGTAAIPGPKSRALQQLCTPRTAPPVILAARHALLAAEHPHSILTPCCAPRTWAART